MPQVNKHMVVVLTNDEYKEAFLDFFLKKNIRYENDMFLESSVRLIISEMEFRDGRMELTFILKEFGEEE